MHMRFWNGLLTMAVTVGLSVPGFAKEDGKKPAKPVLGVLVQPTPKDAAHTGAMVREIDPDGPAAKAGLKAGDIVSRVDDREIKDAKALVAAMETRMAGDKVMIHLWRDGKEQTLAVTLGERKNVNQPARPEAVKPQRPAFLGVQTRNLDDETREKLGVKVEKGAVVVNVVPESPAGKAGLKKDDVIAAVDGKAIANPDELRSAIRKIGVGNTATIKVWRGKEAMEIKSKLDAMPTRLSMLQDFEDRLSGDDGVIPEMPRGFGADLEKRFQEFFDKLRERDRDQGEANE